MAAHYWQHSLIALSAIFLFQNKNFLMILICEMFLIFKISLNRSRIRMPSKRFGKQLRVKNILMYLFNKLILIYMSLS